MDREGTPDHHAGLSLAPHDAEPVSPSQAARGSSRQNSARQQHLHPAANPSPYSINSPPAPALTQPAPAPYPATADHHLQRSGGQRYSGLSAAEGIGNNRSTAGVNSGSASTVEMLAGRAYRKAGVDLFQRRRAGAEIARAERLSGVSTVL